jgi:hypothetical protein
VVEQLGLVVKQLGLVVQQLGLVVQLQGLVVQLLGLGILEQLLGLDLVGLVGLELVKQHLKIILMMLWNRLN